MAKFTKKLQANTLRLIALNRVELDSYKQDGEPSPNATLVTVANAIDSIPFFESISSKQTNTFEILPDNKVLLTDISVGFDGAVTATREIVLRLVRMDSYEFINCL